MCFMYTVDLMVVNNYFVFLVIAQKSLESDYDGLKQRVLGDIDEINKLLIDFW